MSEIIIDRDEARQLAEDPDGARARLGWVVFDAAAPAMQPVGRTLPLEAS